MPEPRLPPRAGLGFKPAHFEAIIAAPPAVGFLEVHAENYMGQGGAPHAQLARLRQDHALSLHGVGLSIGGMAPPDRAHLARLRRLCARYAPESFSEHLAWSRHDGIYYNDLLPLPYTPETLARVARHVDAVQAALGRPMLLENPASYVAFAGETMPEGAFLAEVARRTGCFLLLDVNNLYVAARNRGADPAAELACFPLHAVRQVHLAGHAAATGPEAGPPLLIDDHGAPVADPVWALYARLLEATGPLPTLIEWDNDVPPWPVLLREAARAEALLQPARTRRAA
ncbi:MNIO family bufferin maturase [Teichococcus aestuarii]|uniref:UPF0276 protein CR165_18975 n=1 Tax=Teichococcus aestuarii TaxID=568898 RepID=A0A2U1UZX5_9PROT|nr:DUF692 domain-containing protein [Pseudoroseomonas aestuarii]PWC27194.1 hypothetical protein CR165_18975 [Pseudoroseomonas aestuarii]